MKKQKIKNQYLIVAILILVILGFTSIKSVKIPSNNSQINNEWNFFNLRASALINLTGNPIFIDDLDSLNDWNVAESQTWCSGSGYFNDPYIIRNVLIDGLYLTPCIEIKNSVVWFIIDNSTLYNGRFESIKLTNVTNGVFVNNTLTKNKFGLNALQSYNNTIIENELVNCSLNGIKMDECENNTIIENSVISNTNHGMYLDECYYNSFINNDISQNQDCGAILISGNFNKFIGNYFNNNGENGLQFSTNLCNYNNVTGNTANSNYYSGFQFSGNANNTLFNNTACYNDNFGIEIRGCQNCTVSRNIVKYNHREGMWLSDDYGLFIENNYLKANDKSGFILWESRDLTFRNNIMIGQEEIKFKGTRSELSSFDIDPSNKINGRSVHYYTSLSDLEAANFTNSGHSILVNCTDSTVENSSGVALYYSNNITVQNNDKIFDLYAGVYLYYSDYNNISRNIISDCFKGLSLSYGNFNDINNNTIMNNDEYAIYFQESSNTNISNNKIYECGIGIDAEDGSLAEIMSHNFDTNNFVNDGKLYYYESENYLDNNNFTDAGQIILANCTQAKISNLNTSVSLYYSNDNEITNVNVSHYFNYGIMLHGSHGNNITHSYFNGNSMGLLIRSSNSNNISNNIVRNSLGTGSWEFWFIEDPGNGIFLTSSHNNIVSHNWLENNTHYGLSLRHSDNNDVIGNNVRYNVYGGVYSYHGDNNNINKSRVYQNDGYGMFLKGCNSNTFFDNFISNNNKSGTLLESSDNNEFISNDLCYNEYGTYLDSLCNGNTFYLNNFTSNIILNAYQATGNNWNGVTIGNYWDDYTGKDTNDNNIGDSAHIFGTGTDNFPIWWDAPVISINSPSSSENFEVAPSFEIVVIEGVENTTWYTLDNGLTNITSSGSTSTIDETLWYSTADGSKHLIFYVNDSKGYFDQVSVDITKITDIPQIEIISPALNQEFGVHPPEFTIIITDASSIVSMWYSLDGGITNNSFMGLTDTIATITWNNAPEGEITLTFYAKDLVGNIGFENRIIIKNLSATPPGIPGFNIFILLGAITVVFFVINKRKRF